MLKATQESKLQSKMGWRPAVTLYDPAAKGMVVGTAGGKGVLMSLDDKIAEQRNMYVVECSKGMDLLSVVAISFALDFWRKLGAPSGAALG